MDNKLKEFVINFLEKQREEQKKTLEKEMGILKQNKIVQEVKKFKSPAAKKAMSFLLDTKDDCMKQFELLLDGDGNLIPLEEDIKDKVDAFLKFIVQFGNKRVRKTKREIESYEIANSSAHGWLTEQCYNQRNLFQSGLKEAPIGMILLRNFQLRRQNVCLMRRWPRPVLLGLERPMMRTLMMIVITKL